MVRGSVFVVLACSSYLLVIQTLVPRTIAIRITPNVDEFMIDNQRTRTKSRQNYVVQQALDDGISVDIDNLPHAAIADTFEETSPEELTAQIVDYANMIRNNIIFLDNSVETTTRKRGNIRKKNQAIPDTPCTCESVGDDKVLGEDHFPTRLETQICSGTCHTPYRCTPQVYSVPVLKRIFTSNEKPTDSNIPIPRDFHNRWIAYRVNVTSYCACVRDYIVRN